MGEISVVTQTTTGFSYFYKRTRLTKIDKGLKFLDEDNQEGSIGGHAETEAEAQTGLKNAKKEVCKTLGLPEEEGVRT